jgi:hypothetical protein
MISPRVEFRALNDDEPPEYLRTKRTSHLETHRVGRYTRRGGRHCQSPGLVDRSGPPGGCRPDIVGRAAIMSTIVDRAARRGEMPTGTDAAEAIQAVTVQLCYRLVRRRRAAQPGDADRASAIAAARGGTLSAHPRSQ